MRMLRNICVLNSRQCSGKAGGKQKLAYLHLPIRDYRGLLPIGERTVL